MYELIADGDQTTVAEEVVADDPDTARDGEFDEMAAGQKSALLDLFDTVGNPVTELIEVETTELQGLAMSALILKGSSSSSRDSSSISSRGWGSLAFSICMMDSRQTV